MEFNPLKPKEDTNAPKRPRSQSSFFQEIIEGFEEQEQEQIRHEFEEYENIHIDDICLDITMNSINEMVDLKGTVKDGVDAILNIKAVSIIRKKKAQLEKALNSSKNISARDRFIFVYCSILLHALVYLLGSHPGSLFLYCMALITVGFFWTRFYLYTLINKPMHMLEFLYYSSVIFSVFLVHYPDSQVLYLFSFCASLQLVSVSMVMEKLNRIADLFLKLGPLIVMWNIHWNLRGTEEHQTWNFYDASKDSLSIDFILTYVFTCTQIYAFWAIPYLLLVPMESQRYGKIKALQEKGIKGKIMYMVYHYLMFISAGLILGIGSYFYQPVHILTIILTACYSFWNGGKYYMSSTSTTNK